MLTSTPLADLLVDALAGSPDAPAGVSARLARIIHADIQALGGWMGFDDFMTRVLYSPGLGYYANGLVKFGAFPAKAAGDGREQGEGSDFVTAPEMTPLFGQTLATQVAQALKATSTDEIWEFGAGSGALALQLLDELTRLGCAPVRYTIIDLSGSLRARQQTRLANYRDVVRWVSELPESLQGVVIGNEVLDAMPVKLLARKNGEWFERGLAMADDAALAWADRPTALRPPVDIEGEHDYLTEIHQQAQAFVRTLGDRMVRGAVFLIDYGFPEAEYYHPQRHMGTVMCHQAHRADSNPLLALGLKDITAHVDFTGIAMAAQDAGFEVLGYCTQARFLMNSGLLTRLAHASLPDTAMAQKLIMEHEMGELFKVIGLSKGVAADAWEPLGFAQGDRTHTL